MEVIAICEIYQLGEQTPKLLHLCDGSGYANFQTLLDNGRHNRSVRKIILNNLCGHNLQKFKQKGSLISHFYFSFYLSRHGEEGKVARYQPNVYQGRQNLSDHFYTSPSIRWEMILPSSQPVGLPSSLLFFFIDSCSLEVNNLGLLPFLFQQSSPPAWFISKSAITTRERKDFWLLLDQKTAKLCRGIRWMSAIVSDEAR